MNYKPLQNFKTECPRCGHIVEGVTQTDSPLRGVGQTLRCPAGHEWVTVLPTPVTLAHQ
jgi:hypothetical protein